MLTFILGGARSGKSRLAQRLAMAAGRVVYIATLRVDGDAEMAARVAQHRAHRPSAWPTVEAPLALADAVAEAARDAEVVLVDCLTLWLSNLFWEHGEGEAAHIEALACAEIQRIAEVALHGSVILVSNEVGMATVPEGALTRAFRDAQGRLNQCAAEAADDVILTVAGLPLYLKRRQP